MQSKSSSTIKNQQHFQELEENSEQESVTVPQENQSINQRVFLISDDVRYCVTEGNYHIWYLQKNAAVITI